MKARESEPARERRRVGGREGGRGGGRKGGRKGGREGGREEGREEGREGGWEEEMEGGREGKDKGEKCEVNYALDIVIKEAYKRDLYIRKMIYIYEKRPIKQTYTNNTRPHNKDAKCVCA